MKKRRVRLRFKLLLLMVFLAYAGVTIYGQQMKISDLCAEQETLSIHAQQVQTELERLEHKSEFMDTDDYVENTAREKFGLVYENEIVIEPSEEKTE